MHKSICSAVALGLSLGWISPVSADPQDWTGFYLTIGVGVAATDIGLNVADGTAAVGAPNDAAGYAAIGHDWALGDLTFGVLLDGDLTRGSDLILLEGKALFGESDWFATLRARVGAPLNDKLRVFASGGLAAINAEASLLGALGESRTIKGRTYGLGFEYALSPGQHLSIEYLHADFGQADFFDGNVQMNPSVDTLRVGFTLRF